MNRLSLEVAVIHLARAVSQLAASLDEVEKEHSARGEPLPDAFHDKLATAKRNLGKAVDVMTESENG